MTTSQSSFIQAMDQTHSSKTIGENGAAELTAQGVEEDRVALFFPWYLCEKNTTPGVTMLSGFSPFLMKVLLDGDSFPTPYSGFWKALDGKEFDNVREILNSLSEKKLKFYKMGEVMNE